MLRKAAIACTMLLAISGCKSGMMYDNTGKYASAAKQVNLQKNIGNVVYFDFDSSKITPEAMETLKQQAMWMRANPKARVTVEGHADERGTREYNLALGNRRAEAARRAIVSHGVSRSRVGLISYGKERPAHTNHDAESHAKNRRAVTVLKP